MTQEELDNLKVTITIKKELNYVLGDDMDTDELLLIQAEDELSDEELIEYIKNTYYNPVDVPDWVCFDEDEDIKVSIKRNE